MAATPATHVPMEEVLPAIPGPSTAAIPGPSTAAIPGPSTAAIPGPSTAAIPGPSTAATSSFAPNLLNSCNRACDQMVSNSF